MRARSSSIPNLPWPSSDQSSAVASTATGLEPKRISTGQLEEIVSGIRVLQTNVVLIQQSIAELPEAIRNTVNSKPPAIQLGHPGEPLTSWNWPSAFQLFGSEPAQPRDDGGAGGTPPTGLASGSSAAHPGTNSHKAVLMGDVNEDPPRTGKRMLTPTASCIARSSKAQVAQLRYEEGSLNGTSQRDSEDMEHDWMCAKESWASPTPLEETTPRLVGGTSMQAVTCKPPRPHLIFEETVADMAKNDYLTFKESPESSRGWGIALSSRDAASQSQVTSFRPPPCGFMRCKSLPLHPQSRVRTVMDVMSTLVLALDAIYVPIMIAFDMKARGPLKVLTWCLLTFWTLDLVLNFATGVTVGAQVIMTWSGIACRYLQGPFWVDFVVLVLDYVDFLVSMINPDAQSASLKALKFLRFIKVTRMLRVVAKLRRGLLMRVDTMVSYWVHMYGLVGYAHYMQFVVALVKLFFMLAWLVHLGTCLWIFIIHNMESELHNDSEWCMQIDMKSKMSKYINGIYWSVTAMFSGASYLQPSRDWEFLFAGVFVILGALIMTSITSALAAVLIESQEMQLENKKKIRALTRWMEDYKIPVMLALQVRSCLIQQLNSEPRQNEEDLKFLDLIGAGLRSQLRENQYGWCFRQKPLFRILHVLYQPFIQELCFSASKFEVVPPGEQIFPFNVEIPHAILCTHGSLRYLDQRHHLFKPARKSNRIDTFASIGTWVRVQPEINQWICELAILMQWRTVGVLETIDKCEMLYLSTESFIKVLTAAPAATNIAAVASEYAHRVCQVFNSSRHQPNDLESHIDSQEVVNRMHWTIREFVSLPVLDRLRRLQHHFLAGKRKKKNFLDLESEVHSGKCHLVAEDEDTFCRVVQLSVLYMTSKDGRVCVQLGEQCAENGAIVPKFGLPAQKVRHDQTCEEALEELVTSMFNGLPIHLVNEPPQTVTIVQESPSFGCPTKYIKTIQQAKFNGTSLDSGSDVRKTTSKASRWISVRTAQSLRSGGDALRKHGLGPSDLGDIERTFVIDRPDQKSCLYTWMDPVVLDKLLNEPRNAVEEEVEALRKSYTATQWQRFSQWRVRMGFQSSPSGEYWDVEC